MFRKLFGGMSREILQTDEAIDGKEANFPRQSLKDGPRLLFELDQWITLGITAKPNSFIQRFEGI
jgi:hypothetical protein